MQRRGDQPSVLQHVQRALVFAEAVGQRAIELQPVAVGPHAAVAKQIARVLMAEQVFAGRHRAGIEFGERRLQLEVERDRRLPRTRTADSRAASWRRRSRSPDRSGRWRRPRAAPGCRSPSAPPRCARGLPRSARRRSSSSRRCSRDRDSRASRRAAPTDPCRDSSSRRRHRRTRADRRCGRDARPAGGTAACPRSWPPRPTPPCRWCRPRPSARHGRPAFRSTSSPPRPCRDRDCRRRRRAAISDRPPVMRGAKRSRIRPPWP